MVSLTSHRAKWRNAWFRAHEGYWFVPALMGLAIILLAAVTLTLDANIAVPQSLLNTWLVVSGSEAVSVLTMISGSMITVAGVVFSITIVTLSMASSQFGPRLLRTFMADTGTQIVLGTFTATFLYCLIVLRVVSESQEPSEVPQISVAVACMLAVASLGVLIFFMHHVSVIIQANHIVKVVGDDLDEAVRRLFPEEAGFEPQTQPVARPPELAWFDDPTSFETISTRYDGYIDVIDTDALLGIASQQDLVLKLLLRPGDVVYEGQEVLLVSPSGKLNDRQRCELRDAFIISTRRTPQQDIECSVNELVEIGSRALSPGINDPTTAVHCIDRLGAALSKLAAKNFPSPYRYDDQQKLRLIARPFSFRSIVDSAFDDLRQFGRPITSLTIRLLETLTRIAANLRRPEDALPLLRQANMIRRGAMRSLPERNDRNDVAHRFQQFKRALRSRQQEVEQQRPQQPVQQSLGAAP